MTVPLEEIFAQPNPCEALIYDTNLYMFLLVRGCSLPVYIYKGFYRIQVSTGTWPDAGLPITVPIATCTYFLA